MGTASCKWVLPDFTASPFSCSSRGYLSYNVPSKMLQEKLGFQEMFTEHFSLDGREIEVVENVLWKTP